MIKEKDAIRMKVPFPNMDSGLAVQAHMYICAQESYPRYGYIKCQTLKPNMLTSGFFKHYVDEPADICRNPFQRTSRIDCDKLFETSAVKYHDGLKTTSRPDICQELYNAIQTELHKDGYEKIILNEEELVSLNHLIEKV